MPLAPNVDEELRHIVAQSLGIPLAEVGPGLTMEQCGSWSSLTHLMMMAQLESAFGVTFTNEELRAMTSYDAIAAAVARHRG